MKTVLYFILSVLTIVYVGFMCYININPDILLGEGWFNVMLFVISRYGGVALVFVFAFVNFFGSPLKAIFFTVLILVAIVYIITAVVPGLFTGAKAFIDLGGLWINF